MDLSPGTSIVPAERPLAACRRAVRSKELLPSSAAGRAPRARSRAASGESPMAPSSRARCASSRRAASGRCALRRATSPWMSNGNEARRVMSRAPGPASRSRERPRLPRGERERGGDEVREVRDHRDRGVVLGGGAALTSRRALRGARRRRSTAPPGRRRCRPRRSRRATCRAAAPAYPPWPPNIGWAPTNATPGRTAPRAISTTCSFAPPTSVRTAPSGSRRDTGAEQRLDATRPACRGRSPHRRRAAGPARRAPRPRRRRASACARMSSRGSTATIRTRAIDGAEGARERGAHQPEPDDAQRVLGSPAVIGTHRPTALATAPTCSMSVASMRGVSDCGPSRAPSRGAGGHR